MAAARAQALRALLARCSTKCHRRAFPSPSSSAPAAASFSSLRGAAPFPASSSRRLLPGPRAASVAAARARAHTQMRSLASRVGGREVGSEDAEEEEDEQAQEWAVEWEDSEDDGYDPEIGDGGDGGGVALRDVKWGERAIAAAQEVLAEHFGDDVAMFAFKVSPKGYVYLRLDKLTNMSVSSPGAERLLKVPEDLDRFKDMAMRVQYLAEGDSDLASKQNLLKDGIFLLESVDAQAEHCIWKLADVKENRAETGKGRPLNRKQKDWRLQTLFTSVKKVTLYLDSN
ncbi:hypothetical protein BAE44_0025731 [Dichanthelium oligosanthes]|uniref:DUF7912 domain-containing protein n=1 Tax=Dichanthelium oligosanthes TaxID=888268 RepID=A0A1E5UKA5_9POAL|nr:hypothetical protein BAE44_0025731 [Dichanthelium oligosanthes]